MWELTQAFCLSVYQFQIMPCNKDYVNYERNLNIMEVILTKHEYANINQTNSWLVSKLCIIITAAFP